MSASTRSSAARSPLRTSCSNRVTSPGWVMGPGVVRHAGGVEALIRRHGRTYRMVSVGIPWCARRGDLRHQLLHRRSSCTSRPV